MSVHLLVFTLHDRQVCYNWTSLESKILEQESESELGKDYLKREVGRHAIDLSRSGDETELEVNVPGDGVEVGMGDG